MPVPPSICHIAHKLCLVVISGKRELNKQFSFPALIIDVLVVYLFTVGVESKDSSLFKKYS